MNSTFISIRNLTCVLGASALLSMAGCGSGGGGGGGGAAGGTTTTPIAVTGAKSQSLAKVSLSGLTMSSLGSGMSSLGTGVTGVQVAGTSPRGMSVRNLIDYVVQQVETRSSTPQGLTGVTLLATSTCQVSGQQGMTDTRALSTDPYTSTDVITMTFSKCVNVSGGSSLDGSIAISNMIWNAGNVGSRTLAKATMTFNFVMATPASGAVPASTFTMSNVAVTHDTTVTDKITDSLTGTSLKLVSGANTDEISGFTFSSTQTISTGSVSDISNFTIGSTTIGGSITVATPTAFVTTTPGANPSAGVMQVTSNVTPADPGALRITVNGNNITVDFYQNGFNSALTTSNNYTWTTI